MDFHGDAKTWAFFLFGFVKMSLLLSFLISYVYGGLLCSNLSSLRCRVGKKKRNLSNIYPLFLSCSERQVTAYPINSHDKACKETPNPKRKQPEPLATLEALLRSAQQHPLHPTSTHPSPLPHSRQRISIHIANALGSILVSLSTACFCAGVSTGLSPSFFFSDLRSGVYEDTDAVSEPSLPVAVEDFAFEAKGLSGIVAL